MYLYNIYKQRINIDNGLSSCIDNRFTLFSNQEQMNANIL